MCIIWFPDKLMQTTMIPAWIFFSWRLGIKKTNLYISCSRELTAFIPARPVCLCGGRKWMTEAPNYIKTHSCKEHCSLNTVIEAMHQIERPAIDRQRRLHNHSAERPEIERFSRSRGLINYSRTRREEAITEHQIHHPAATRHKGRERLIQCKRSRNHPPPHGRHDRTVTGCLSVYRSKNLYAAI